MDGAFSSLVDPNEIALLDKLPCPVVAATQEGLIAHVNTLALSLFGYDRSLLGRPIWVLMPERMRERHKQGFQRYCATGVSHFVGRPVCFPALRADGEEFEIELTLRTFQRPDGTRLIVANIADIANTQSAEKSVLEIEVRFARRAYRLV